MQKSAVSDKGISVVRYDGVQALRFLAAIMVVLVHSTFYAQERLDPGIDLYHLGANGVALFFVISGFVLGISAGAEPQSSAWRGFALKRILRIVPLYWLITTLKLFIMLLAPSAVLHSELDLTYILKSYLFVPALNVDGNIQPFFGVGWTLNFEMMFYLLFAVAIAVGVRPLRFCGPILVGLAIASAFKSEAWAVPLRFFADLIVLNFLYGMMIAAAARKGWKLPRWVAVGSLLLSLGYLFVFADYIPSGDYTVLLYGLASGLTVLACVSLEDEVRRLHMSPVIFLGAASYSLYLVHPIIAPIAPTLLSRLGWNWPVVSIVSSLVISIGASVLVYRYIEAPLTKVLTRFLGGNHSKIIAKPKTSSNIP